MREFDGKVVWVVGASGGLGSAIARGFLTAGATVFLSGRDRSKLQAAIAGDLQDRAVALPMDITQQSSVESAGAELIARARRLDVLVNTTSVSVFGDFLKLSDEQWRQIYEAKLFAYARTMRVAIPHMLDQGGGAIVNVSGSGGKYPNSPSHIAGCSGNAAVNLTTKAVADLYAAQNIRANCIAPGPIETPRLRSLSTANADTRAAATGGGRLQVARDWDKPGKPEDIADAALFLASARSRHINGIVLTVDGGATPTVE